MTDRKKEPIRIIAYDGHRADVRPRKVIDQEIILDVIDIEHAWVETGIETTSPVIHGFVVRCSGSARYRILHHSSNGWSAYRIVAPCRP